MTGVDPTRNLLIVHTPERQALSDWLEVQERVRASAADIDVRIASNLECDARLQAWQVTRPSLLFSAERLRRFRPRGGTIYAGHDYDKAQQMLRLARIAVPVPTTLQLSPECRLDPADWGDHVIVKPLLGRRGEHIRLVASAEVKDRYAELTSAGRRRMLIQRYVAPEAGRPHEYRVLTLFGRALYCCLGRWRETLAPLDELVKKPLAVVASNADAQRERTLVSDEEVIALGERAHAAFPGVAVLGTDVVRESGSGQLYVLECNPSGSTWHFSSRLAQERFSAELVRGLYAQRAALALTAELLIEKTRAEAS